MAGSVKTNRVVHRRPRARVAVARARALFASPEQATRGRLPPGTDLRRSFEQISGDSILHTVRFLSHQQTRRYASQGSAAAVASSRLDSRVWGSRWKDTMSRWPTGSSPARSRNPGAQPTAAHERRRDVVTNVLADLSAVRARRKLAHHLRALRQPRRDRGDLAPGADDNASGVAVLLEAARVLARVGDRAASDARLLRRRGGQPDRLERVCRRSPRRPPAASRSDQRRHGGLRRVRSADIVVFTNPQFDSSRRRGDRNRAARDAISSPTRRSRRPGTATMRRSGAPASTAISIWEGYDHNPYNDTTKDTPADSHPGFSRRDHEARRIDGRPSGRASSPRGRRTHCRRSSCACVRPPISPRPRRRRGARAKNSTA